MLRKVVSLGFAAVFALGVALSALAQTAEPSGITLNGTVRIIAADIQTSNGVIHVIDAVLLPPADAATQEAATVEADATAEADVTDEAAATLETEDLDAIEGNIQPEATVETEVLEAAEEISEELATAEAEGLDTTATDEADATTEAATTAEATSAIALEGIVYTEGNTIADVVANSPRLSTLLLALQTAGLDTVFAEDGSYTVFAPTNEAFEALALAQGLESSVGLVENIVVLSNILTYHVLPQAFTLDELAVEVSVTTLNGSAITIGSDGNGASTTVEGVSNEGTDVTPTAESLYGETEVTPDATAEGTDQGAGG